MSRNGILDKFLRLLANIVETGAAKAQAGDSKNGPPATGRRSLSRVSTEKAGHLQVDQVDGLIAAAGVDGAREILEAFRRSTADLLENMAVQIGKDDFGAAAATAHAVKGSAANVGASRLAQSAAQLESACKQSTDDNVRDLLDAVRKDFESARRCFEEHLANT